MLINFGSAARLGGWDEDTPIGRKIDGAICDSTHKYLARPGSGEASRILIGVFTRSLERSNHGETNSSGAHTLSFERENGPDTNFPPAK